MNLIPVTLERIEAGGRLEHLLVILMLQAARCADMGCGAIAWRRDDFEVQDLLPPSLGKRVLPAVNGAWEANITRKHTPEEILDFATELHAIQRMTVNELFMCGQPPAIGFILRAHSALVVYQQNSTAPRFARLYVANDVSGHDALAEIEAVRMHPAFWLEEEP